MRERNQLGDLGVDGRIIVEWILRKWDGGDMDRIGLTQDKDRWRTLVEAALDIRIA